MVQAERSAYVRPTARVLGRQVNLEDLDDADVFANLKVLRSEGVDGAGVSELDSMELAAAVVSSANGRALVDGLETDVVVVCTDSLEGMDPTEWMTRFQEISGTALTTSLMVSGHACANVILGLETCRSLIVSGAARTALLVTADRNSTSRSRFTPVSKSVYSDGAAACIVSTEPAEAFEILHCGMQGQVMPLGVAGGMSEARTMLLSMASATSKALGGGEADSVQHVLSLNLGKTSRALLAMAASVSLSKVRAGSAASFGHCFSADILIALEDLLEEGCRPGDRVLMLASGRHIASALSLARTNS